MSWFPPVVKSTWQHGALLLCFPSWPPRPLPVQLILVMRFSSCSFFCSLLFLPLIWPHAFSSNRKPSALEHVAVTFTRHLQMCWGDALLTQRIRWDGRPSSLPGGLCEGTMPDVLKHPPPPLQTDPAGRTKKILVLNCVFHHLKRDGEWGRSETEKQVRGMHDPDCAELGTVFSSLWSVRGWTLWHLICRADETLPCLNWSGFVSSLLSHDPLLYGSVRGGGEPPWVCSIGGIAICLLLPHWEDVRLKLFYAWLNSLFHSSASYLLLSPLPPSFFFFFPTVSLNESHHS